MFCVIVANLSELRRADYKQFERSFKVIVSDFIWRSEVLLLPWQALASKFDPNVSRFYSRHQTDK
jgi:hypothetical protein